ncbi:MAG TPA: DUF2339 domain-containing protein, partial [Phycisphaerales bacterium]|nr:DUF2339 domain-containing protein [Phycisphaerales bacterium]
DQTLAPDPAMAQPDADRPRKQFNLEWIIGTRGLAAAGALAVVIGVIFFLRYAVEQGWIGRLPPLVRCLFGAGFGALLVAAGELARRKVNALAAAGLYAAGIACAYASTYAGYGYFQPPVLSQPVAFVALAAISALGIALSASTRLASVAIVSLVGAYLAPFLMQSQNANPLVFPVYTGVLLATGLLLAAWLRGAFRWVGAAVWWATMLLGGAWAAFSVSTVPVIVILYALAVWTAIHVAHIAAARGALIGDHDDHAPARTPGLRGAGPMLSSFSVTGWATVLMVAGLRHVSPALDWLAPCGMTAATGALSVWLAGHLGVLRSRPRTGAERLGASLALQAGSALIGTVALATSSAGPAAALLWLCMGVGAIAAGRWARAVAACIYGNVLLVIGTARLVLWDSWQSSLFSPTVDVGGVLLSPWTAWAGLAAAAWVGAGWILSIGTARDRRHPWGSVLAGIGVVVACAALVHADSDFSALTWAYIGLAVIVLAVHRVRPQLTLHMMSFALLTVVSLKVAAVDVLGGRTPVDVTRFLGLPLTDSLFLCAGLAAAWSFLALSARARIGTLASAAGRATACAIAAVVMLMLAPLKQDVAVATLVWPWAAVAVLAASAARADRRLHLGAAGLLTALCAAFAWLMAYVVTPGFVQWNLDAAPLAHPGLLGSFAVAFACVAVAMLGMRQGTGALNGPAALIVGAFTLWLATSFEASRLAELLTGSATARGAVVSIWWGLLAVGLLYAGFRRATPGLRYTGLTLLGLAGAKVVLLDMADAPQLARVAGFVTLGLLMLGTAVGYARVIKALDTARPKAGSENQTPAA